MRNLLIIASVIALAVGYGVVSSNAPQCSADDFDCLECSCGCDDGSTCNVCSE